MEPWIGLSHRTSRPLRAIRRRSIHNGQSISRRRHPCVHVGQNRNEAKSAHTLTACCRCRTVGALETLRKVTVLRMCSGKQDATLGLPRCGPCERSNATCDYLDTTKGKVVSRSYVVHLQDKVQRLEKELGYSIAPFQMEWPMPKPRCETQDTSDSKKMTRPRILGPSSGIGMTRLGMASAKRNNHTHSIKDIVPESKAQEVKDRFAEEDQKATSKVYPLISSVAAVQMPSRELTNSLVESFNAGAQYLLPTLHEPSFWGAVDDVYEGDLDPYKNFILRIVIAISMQRLSAQYAGLADSYYLASLPFLEHTVRLMDLRTLQALVLVAQYSLVTPTRTAAYWVVGLAVRLCHELGITEEATITISDANAPLSALQIDMRRRLYWNVTSMGVWSGSLARPSKLCYVIRAR